MMGKKIATILAIIVVLLVALAVYFLNPFQKKRYSGLQVITNEIETSLFIDNVHLDKSPYINRKIQPGRYVLNIVPDDNQLMAKELPINLTPNTLTAVFWKPAKTLEESSGVVYELEPISNKDTGELQIITEPNEAIIHFGNREQQFAPYIFQDVEPGTHSFTLSLPSYETQEQKFNLSAGYRLKITAYMGREKGAEVDQIPQEAVEEEMSEEETQLPPENTPIETNNVTVLPTNFFQQEIEVLRVRDGSSASAAAVGFVKVGEKYAFLKEENNWFFITFEDTISQEIKEGWVSGQYVKPERVSTSLSEID